MNQAKHDYRYLKAISEIRTSGRRFPNGERTGVGRRGAWQLQMCFPLYAGFPLLTVKSVPFRWVVEELRWFMSGSTYEQHLYEKGVDIWKEWATKEQCAKFGRRPGHLGPIYGHQWRNYGARRGQRSLGPRWSYAHRRWVNDGYEDNGFDQLKALVEGIQNNPASTRLILSGWNPAEANQVALPPCHTLYHVKCHDGGGLSAALYQRSCDMVLGVPFNIASYALLTELLAHVTGRSVVEFVHTLGDAHVYDNHWDAVDTMMMRLPRESPLLRLSGRLKGVGFDGLLDFQYEDVTLEGYDPHPKIEAEVAV